MFEHGFCLLWDNNLILWSVITNTIIAITYYLIPLILFRVIVKTQLEIPKTFKNTLLFFVFFIFFCGTGHLIDILLIWVPWYWFKIIWDGLTGLISIIALILLIPLVKRFIIFIENNKAN